MSSTTIIGGNAMEELDSLDENSIHAVVTDPPYGIAFRGEDWDNFRRRENDADVGRDGVGGRLSAKAPASGAESNPYEYDGYTERDEAYSKKTCLWTGGGFVMPDVEAAESYDNRIHEMTPSEDRGEKRSVTPLGFSRAVYYANESMNSAVHSQSKGVK